MLAGAAGAGRREVGRDEGASKQRSRTDWNLAMLQIRMLKLLALRTSSLLGVGVISSALYNESYDEPGVLYEEGEGMHTNRRGFRMGLFRSCRDLETFSLLVGLTSSGGTGLLVMKWVIFIEKKSSTFWIATRIRRPFA